MPTPDEAREWLAHAFENNELAHHGILGMHWGVYKEPITASGIYSREIDAAAKKDAQDYAKMHFAPKQDAAPYSKMHVSPKKDAVTPVAIKTKQINDRIDSNSQYAKAYSYHIVKTLRTERRKSKARSAGILTGVAASAAYLNKDFLQKAANSAVLKISARRGAAFAKPVLQAIGNKPIVSLVKGADGIFRFAA